VSCIYNGCGFICPNVRRQRQESFRLTDPKRVPDPRKDSNSIGDAAAVSTVALSSAGSVHFLGLCRKHTASYVFVVQEQCLCLACDKSVTPYKLASKDLLVCARCLLVKMKDCWWSASSSSYIITIAIAIAIAITITIITLDVHQSASQCQIRNGQSMSSTISNKHPQRVLIFDGR
jgi:hypothetical protein